MLADVKIASQERLKRELLTFFNEISRLRPVVLFLEDVHWADASTVDLLSYVGSRIAGMRLLVVATYRPSDLLLAKHPFLQVRQELQAHGACREVALQFLSSFRHRTIPRAAVPRAFLPRYLASSVHGCTEGNALFMVDLLRYLQTGESSRRRMEGGLWRGRSPSQLELPESVRSMIERKIDQLDEPARRLAAAAAVQGNEFDSATVAKALAMDPAEVEERLERLERLHGWSVWWANGNFPTRP